MIMNNNHCFKCAFYVPQREQPEVRHASSSVRYLHHREQFSRRCKYSSNLCVDVTRARARTLFLARCARLGRNRTNRPIQYMETVATPPEQVATISCSLQGIKNTWLSLGNAIFVELALASVLSQCLAHGIQNWFAFFSYRITFLSYSFPFVLKYVCTRLKMVTHPFKKKCLSLINRS